MESLGGEKWATLTTEQKQLKLILGKDMRCEYVQVQNGEEIRTKAWGYLQAELQTTLVPKLTIEQYGTLQYLSAYKGDTLKLTTTNLGDMYMIKE